MTLQNRYAPLSIHSLPLPGTYPHIVKHLPKIGGLDNMGPGNTQHGESFLLKKGGLIGASEFIGSGLCDACGIPYCVPSIVTMDYLGGIQHVFGSRIELGLKKFDQTSVAEWKAAIATCANPSIFSAMLAIDLALGNDDRHWGNWLVQDVTAAGSTDSYRMRALDFSHGWPVSNPAQLPSHHISINTWEAVKYWETLGVTFDQHVFYETCVRMGCLPSRWLRNQILNQLRGIFLSQAQVDQLCDWWESCWREQVIEVIHSIENGARP